MLGFTVDGLNGLSRVLDVLELEVSRGGIARYHAMLQFLVALDLHRRGFDVSVEEPVDGGFKADVYAEGPTGRVIVEIETGYVPPDRMYELEGFLEAKVAFKAVAYSFYTDLFVVATPSHMSLSIPEELLKPIESRSVEDVIAIRELALRYDRVKASRILWRAHASRVDGVAYINVSDRRVYYLIPLNPPSSPKVQILNCNPDNQVADGENPLVIC
jgi:hypothetical protein